MRRTVAGSVAVRGGEFLGRSRVRPLGVSAEGAGGDGEKREADGFRVGDGFAGGEMVEGGFEMRTLGEGFAPGTVHFRLGIREVDAGKGLGDVEVAGLAGGIGAVPVEDAVGGVRVLLDFVDEEAGPDGVEAPGLDEYGLSFAWG